MPKPQLETVWGRMAAIYGHRWTSSYGDEPASVAGDTWAAGLAGLTGAQLARGLKAHAFSLDGWPPSLPAFRSACLGIPVFFDVLQMLRPGAVNVSPFARYCWGLLDPYALRRADAKNERAMMREAYDAACRFVLQGGELPGPVEFIEHDPAAELRFYDAQHMARLKALNPEATH